MKITMPTNIGWSVDWYTGKTRTKANGEIVRYKDTFESTSREKVEAKVEELKKQGFEIAEIYECIF